LEGLPTGYTQFWVYDSEYQFNGVKELYEVPPLTAMATSLGAAVREELKPVQLRLTRSGRIRARVVDGAGKPRNQFGAAAILVQVTPRDGEVVGSWGGSAEVDGNGAHDFTGVTPGVYRISARPNPGGSGEIHSADHLVTVEPGQTVEVKISWESKP